MKLLVANHTARTLGGAELYLQSIVPALAERGWSVGTLFETGPGGYEFTSDRKERHVVTYRPEQSDRMQALEPVLRWGPEIVLQNGLLNPKLEASLLSVAPGVLFAHGFYGTCVSGHKRFAAPAFQACHRKFGSKCLALYYPRRCGGLNPLSAVAAYRLQSSRHMLLRQYVRICVASAALRQEYLRNGVMEAAIAVLPLFPDRARPDALPPSSSSTNGPVLFVGRLTPQKGGTLLLHAAAQAQRVRARPMEIQFVGEGAERAPLERLASRLGVRATFFGWCDVTTRQSLMRAASLLAIPSTSPETFAIVGLEAGCVGLPAVAFAGGGVSEWLIDGYSGIAADGEKPRVETLVAAIVEALEDPVTYERLRRGAWEVSHRFSLERHVNQLHEILRTALTQRGGANDFDKSDAYRKFKDI